MNAGGQIYLFLPICTPGMPDVGFQDWALLNVKWIAHIASLMRLPGVFRMSSSPFKRRIIIDSPFFPSLFWLLGLDFSLASFALHL